MSTKISEGPKHARLSPSAAHRWLECPGSVRASSNSPDVPSIYAAEGTLLHTWTEYALTMRLVGADPVYPTTGSEHAVDGFTFAWCDEYEQLCEWCVERVLALLEEIDDPCAIVELEYKADLSAVEDGMFGTSDVVIISPKMRTIYVFDHKFGQGVRVYAAGNPQLICYAVGTLGLADLMCDIARVVYGVLQPRLDHYDSAEMPIDELHAWRDRLHVGALDTHKPDARLHAGDHCRFCPAKAFCPEVEKQSLTVARDVFADDPFLPAVPIAEFPATRIAEIVAKADMVRKWLDAVEAEAMRRLETGLEVPGFKLVAGRKSRQWSSEDAMRNWAKEHGVVPHDLKLLSPAQMEKLCKSAKIPFPNMLVSEVSGNVSLAPAADKRPAVGPVFEAIASESNPIDIL